MKNPNAEDCQGLEIESSTAKDTQNLHNLKEIKSTNTILPEDIIQETEKLIKSIEPHEKLSNPFPTEIFPAKVQELILETNQFLNFPIDFISCSILYAASVSIGNTYRVHVKNGWTESSVLYMALVSPPGTNKSHPLSFALNPIVEADRKSYRLYESQKREYDRLCSMNSKERQSEGYGEPEKPYYNKILLSDFTIEALSEVHRTNRRGLGVYCDELVGWFKNFNRYHKGSEMEFWLSSWSGKPINIDRKTGEPIFIPKPFVSVSGTVQNGVLHELSRQGSENGFVDRILFVIPDNISKHYWTDAELPPQRISDWSAIINNLLSLPLTFDDFGSPMPTILRFSEEAKNLLFEWQKSNTDEANLSGDDMEAGLLSKLEIYVIRFALILELLSFACEQSDKSCINIRSVQGAIALSNYFKRTAYRVHEIIDNVDPLAGLHENKRNIYNALPQVFTTNEGLSIALTQKMAERTFERFIKEPKFFIKLKHGLYQKNII